MKNRSRLLLFPVTWLALALGLVTLVPRASALTVAEGSGGLVDFPNNTPAALLCLWTAMPSSSNTASIARRTETGVKPGEGSGGRS